MQATDGIRDVRFFYPCSNAHFDIINYILRKNAMHDEHGLMIPNITITLWTKIIYAEIKINIEKYCIRIFVTFLEKFKKYFYRHILYKDIRNMQLPKKSLVEFKNALNLKLIDRCSFIHYIEAYTTLKFFNFIILLDNF